MITTPSRVGNQSFPSRVLMPDGSTPPLAFDTLHAIDLAVGRGGNLLQLTLGKCVQVALTYPVHASTAAYPEVAMRIFKNPKYAVIKQTVLYRITGELPILEARQAAFIGSNP